MSINELIGRNPGKIEGRDLVGARPSAFAEGAPAFADLLAGTARRSLLSVPARGKIVRILNNFP
jgi:hypothetical protein